MSEVKVHVNAEVSAERYKNEANEFFKRMKFFSKLSLK